MPMMLMAFRHGQGYGTDRPAAEGHRPGNRPPLRAADKKGSLSTHQPIEGDELRAIRAWLREREQRDDARSPYLFLSERGPMTRQAFNYQVAQTGKRAKLRFHVHPHMLRHSTGYYLANRNHDTRLIQDYLGHRNIAHTVRYTRTAASRFEGLWR